MQYDSHCNNDDDGDDDDDNSMGAQLNASAVTSWRHSELNLLKSNSIKINYHSFSDTRCFGYKTHL